MLARRALNSSNWIQMAVFVQGRHRHRHGSVARLMIVMGREAAPRSEVTATRLAVNRVCGPAAPDTPVPLDTESGDTLGLIVGTVASSGSEKKKWNLCQTQAMLVTVFDPGFAIRIYWADKFFFSIPVQLHNNCAH